MTYLWPDPFLAFRPSPLSSQDLYSSQSILHMAETGSEEVATQIQAVYRGHAQRRQTDKLKYDHNQKAVKDYLHQNNIPELMQVDVVGSASSFPAFGRCL